MSVLDKLFNLGNGIRSGIEDVPALLGDVVTGDIHGVLTDGRKLIGDANDVIEGAGALGIEIGRVPAKYLGSFGKLADSPILSAAQLVIEGEKKLTGSGDPRDGAGYSASAVKFLETVETLINAEVNLDAWDGTAANRYDELSKAHRRIVSDMSVADAEVGRVLDTEAGQVVRTRETLDTTSQGLYDYGLATSWMLLVPGLNMAKLAADSAAAAAALGTTNTTMLILANNSLENSRQIGTAAETYEAAKKDSSGEGRFATPEQDQLGNLPTRLHPDTKYTPVKPTTPPPSGPPATPYDAPATPHP
ncbi:EspA/EspE family type VII secretion system effector [Mycolicibacterium sp.]|uniref:EspA/EspE family type VII secretion system effector n=1 Tax=Mycolicibacterium sp. TaxID=2320850 RepID=UPI001A33CEB2|nr:EspA/EspE family type VII secretion system effector [Mycolicibacterium sp.]MBJ7341427.1 hypothetical protein [Mycolicibacterium sp.]